MELALEQLELNPVWSSTASRASGSAVAKSHGRVGHLASSMLAHDGQGRLFAWSATRKVLHCMDLQDVRADSDPANKKRAAPPAASLELVPSLPVTFPVRQLAVNRSGRALALVGDAAVLVVDVSRRVSSAGSSGVVKCSATEVGQQGLFGDGDSSSLRIVQLSWHPLSEAHLSILAADGVFRLFDVGRDQRHPEQEYHLQLGSRQEGAARSLRCPVSFSFGGDHLWERFTVFFLYSDASVAALCPVLPFGCRMSLAKVEELGRDAEAGSSEAGAGTPAARHAAFARAWLGAVFPEGEGVQRGARTAEERAPGRLLRASAHAPLDASLQLQGPLPVVNAARPCDGGAPERLQACALLGTCAGRDTVLAVAGAEGRVRVYVLAGEVQPLWVHGRAPSVTLDEDGQLVSLGMLAETGRRAPPSAAGEGLEERSPWGGDPPGLLVLGTVDLALSSAEQQAALPALLLDPLLPQRMLCHHGLGVDAITIRWLPFSDEAQDAGGLEGEDDGILEVHSVLDTRRADSASPGSTSPVPLNGAVLVEDMAGSSWLVAVTANGECAVQRLPLRGVPLVRALDRLTLQEPGGGKGGGGPEQGGGLNRELLEGPHRVPAALPAGAQALTLASVEGRALLHDRCKVLHERHLEYAHRAYVELAAQARRLQGALEEQSRERRRLVGVLEAERGRTRALGAALQGRRAGLREREERLRLCAGRPGLSQRPLTFAEKEYRAQLATWQQEELPLLRAASQEMAERVQRSGRERGAAGGAAGGALPVPEAQWRRLRAAVEEAAQQVEALVSSLQLAEAALRRRELLADS